MIFNNLQRNQNNQNYLSKSENDINIEISYDNYENIENIRKQQYGIDLRNQIDENRRRRETERRRKQLEDLAEEERIKREREEIDARQKAENKRYRPKIDLPIRKINEVEPLKKVNKKVQKINYDIEETDNNNNLELINQNTLKYLRMKELQMEDYNEKILHQLRLLNQDFNNNINSLKDEIEKLNEMNNKHRSFKNKFYQEVHLIKKDLDNKKIRNIQDTRGIYDIINETDYMKKKLGNMRYYNEEPQKKLEVRSYIANESPDDSRFFIDDNKKSDGLKLSPYINLSHVLSHETPKWTPGIYDTLFV